MQPPRIQYGRADIGRLINLLRNYPQLSRSELAAMSLVTPATIGHQVRDLMEAGWIKESSSRRGAQVGRPRLGLVVNDEAAYAIVAVIGLTTVIVAMVDFGGHILIKREIPQSMAAVARGITVVSQTISEVMAAQALDPVKCAGLGIAIPGIWDAENETVVFSPNLPEWEGMKVGELFRRSVGIEPVVVENDADAAAWGELWFGTGRDVQDMMYILCDVGIGSGLVINRQLVRGQDNSVGEIGHMWVGAPDSTSRCGCGHHGCLEASASLASLNRYVDAGMSLSDALEKIAEYVGMSLSSIINLLCPQALVLGGALLEQNPVLWPLIVQSTRSRVLNHLLHKSQLILSSLGSHAPLLGLASLVFERQLLAAQGYPPESLSPTRWSHPNSDALKFFYE